MIHTTDKVQRDEPETLLPLGHELKVLEKVFVVCHSNYGSAINTGQDSSAELSFVVLTSVTEKQDLLKHH